MYYTIYVCPFYLYFLLTNIVSFSKTTSIYGCPFFCAMCLCFIYFVCSVLFYLFMFYISSFIIFVSFSKAIFSISTITDIVITVMKDHRFFCIDDLCFICNHPTVVTTIANALTTTAAALTTTVLTTNAAITTTVVFFITIPIPSYPFLLLIWYPTPSYIFL